MPPGLTTAQALKLWHDVNLAMVRDAESDLSLRQMTILLTVYLEAPPHTVRDLAAKLGVSKQFLKTGLLAIHFFTNRGQPRILKRAPNTRPTDDHFRRHLRCALSTVPC